MDSSKLFFVFLAICQTKPSWSLTKIQSLLKLLHWTKGVEWVKVRNALGPLCLWQCFFKNLQVSRPNQHESSSSQKEDTLCRLGAAFEQCACLLMIPKVLSQSLLVARIRGESSFSSLYSSSLDCLCLSLGFRISFCFMCLWLWMCWSLRQSWCECASECASVCLCLCGLGAEVTASCPPPLSLPLYSTII